MENRLKKRNGEVYAILTLNGFETFGELKEAKKFLYKNGDNGLVETIIYIVNENLDIVGYRQ